jgi:glycosyltransferase involved in cell wall biosynthesis
MKPSISIILPAKNESAALASLLPSVKRHHPNAEVIVVDDGSSDQTIALCQTHGVRVLSHPYSMGNGAAIKTGARNASADLLVFMDADGQHEPQDIEKLVAKLSDGYDMAVGARTTGSQASIFRSLANRIYNFVASCMVGNPIKDLTSGFRAVKADKFREFLYLLPNGFSYPTTITMAFFRAGYSVAYVPIIANKRLGKSHIHPLKDGMRFFVIIFRVGTLYSPLKIFMPISLLFFLTGLGYYIYTFVTQSRFTNMSALLFTTGVIVGLIGMVSEQITNLLYSRLTDKTGLPR